MSDVRVILKADIAGTQTNITPEDPGTEWVAGTYTQGQERWKSTTHTVYRVAASSTEDDPEDGVLLDPPTWVAIRPTNEYAMYSDVIQEQTEFPDLIETTYDSSTSDLFANSVAVFGAVGTEIEIEASSAIFGGVFYNDSISLTDNSLIINRYRYRYFGFSFKQTGFSVEFTSFSDAIVTVRIKNTGSTAKVGKIVIGENLVLGEALAGVTYEPKVIGRTVTDSDKKVRYITDSVQQIIRGDMKVDTSSSGIIASAMGRRIGADPVPISIDTRYEVLQTYGIITTRHNWNPANAQRVSYKATSLEGTI